MRDDFDPYMAEGLDLLKRQIAEWHRMRTEEDRDTLREEHNRQLNALRARHGLPPKFDTPYSGRGGVVIGKRGSEKQFDWNRAQGELGIGMRTDPRSEMS